MRYTYIPNTVCSKEISFELEGSVVHNINFVGGCNGNLKAISMLLEGKTVEEIEEKLKGNLCGRRPTSCVDQLCIGLREALDKNTL